VSPLQAVAALTAVLSLGGCGQSAEDGIRAALDRYGEATADRDWGTLCDDVLAPDLVAKMRRVGLRASACVARTCCAPGSETSSARA
jgi:hypothetical protein